MARCGVVRGTASRFAKTLTIIVDSYASDQEQLVAGGIGGEQYANELQPLKANERRAVHSRRDSSAAIEHRSYSDELARYIGLL